MADLQLILTDIDRLKGELERLRPRASAQLQRALDVESANLSGDDTRFVALIAGHVLQSSRTWLRILGDT